MCRQRLAPVAALDRLALLVIDELERSAHSLPARHGTRSVFAAAHADHVSFKLRELAKQMEIYKVVSR
jgi:hypothetical protein